MYVIENIVYSKSQKIQFHVSGSVEFSHKERFLTRVKICSEAEFLDIIRTKVLRVFLLAIHSHLY